MAHIDEGTLHALLDGALRAMEPAEADAVEAHLEDCAECRARLEDAAAVRGRAGEILGVLEPSVAPDFEEVLVRAGAADRPERLRRRMRWTRGLAWAATLVIALGTGYLIRDRLGPEGTSSLMAPSAEREQEAASPIQAPENTDEGRQPPTDADIAGGAELESLADRRPATPLVTGEAAAPASTRAGRQSAAPGPPVNDEVVEDSRLDQVRAADRESFARTARAEADGGVSGGAGVQADVPEPRLEMALPAQALKAADVTAPPTSFVALAPGDSAGLQEVAPSAVRELAGTPLAVIPDAEVVQVWVAAAPDHRIVSIQRLEDGTTVRLIQQHARIALESVVVTAAPPEEARRARAAAARPADPLAAASAPEPAEAEPGANRLQTGGGVIGWEMILEGRLPRERLEALAAAAREAWLRASLVRPDR